MAYLQLGLDAYSPREIAEKVQLVGVTKARLPFLQRLSNYPETFAHPYS